MLQRLKTLLQVLLAGSAAVFPTLHQFLFLLNLFVSGLSQFSSRFLFSARKKRYKSSPLSEVKCLPIFLCFTCARVSDGEKGKANGSRRPCQGGITELMAAAVEPEEAIDTGRLRDLTAAYCKAIDAPEILALSMDQMLAGDTAQMLLKESPHMHSELVNDLYKPKMWLVYSTCAP